MQPYYEQFGLRSLGRLGQGGLGVVDQVQVTTWQLGLQPGLIVACKTLRPEFALDPSQLRRFKREIEAAITLGGHRAIVGVLASKFCEQHGAFYVMELHKFSLEALVANPGLFKNVQHLSSIGAEIASAVAFAHDSGFLHRDLKPANILVDQTDRVAVADWGLGKFIHYESRALTVAGMGTERYCSVEQLRSARDVKATADIYSLGIMLAELALGRFPEPFIPGLGIKFDVIPGQSPEKVAFNKLIKKMTALAPGQRHQSMREVEFELLRIARMPPKRHSPYGFLGPARPGFVQPARGGLPGSWG